MLTLYRRHTVHCPHKSKGQDYIKCNCPVWCYGQGEDGNQIRESLKTRDWGRAGRRAAKLESPDARRHKPVKDAVAAFEQHIHSLEPSTQRKYKNVLNHFSDYCKGAGLEDLAEITVDSLDGYRSNRKLARITEQKELETLRQFFGYCRDRDWIQDNPARRIKSARNIKPAEVVPYTPQEVAKIISACDAIGRTPYERRRARAMILLLNNTALRVCDVATLARDRVQNGRIMVRTQKTGDPVYLQVWSETQIALDALPAPRGAAHDCRYFFWNGITARRAVVGIAERTLAAVFKKSGVMNAHAHRFRHTLATRLLEMGGTDQEVADVLGNSPAIVRKHYAKWSQGRQRRIDDLMRAANPCTILVQQENSPVTQ
jgi:site-specific recombinase XerD